MDQMTSGAPESHLCRLTRVASPRHTGTCLLNYWGPRGRHRRETEEGETAPSPREAHPFFKEQPIKEMRLRSSGGGLTATLNLLPVRQRRHSLCDAGERVGVGIFILGGDTILISERSQSDGGDTVPTSGTLPICWGSESTRPPLSSFDVELCVPGMFPGLPGEAKTATPTCEMS